MKLKRRLLKLLAGILIVGVCMNLKRLFVFDYESNESKLEVDLITAYHNTLPLVLKRDNSRQRVPVQAVHASSSGIMIEKELKKRLKRASMRKVCCKLEISAFSSIK